MPGTSQVKKQVLVLVTSTSMTGLRKKTLESVSYIYYLIQFKKDTEEVQVLINSENEVNIMTFTYIKKLGLRIHESDIRAQEIDRSILEIYDMVITGF